MAVSDINNIIISGRLTRDPESRGNGNIAAFSIASNRWYYKNNERVEETVFLDVTAFSYEAKNVLENLKRGSRVVVQGRLELNEWQTDSGEKRKQLRMIANSVHARALGPANDERVEQQRVEEPAAEPVAASSPPVVDDIPF